MHCNRPRAALEVWGGPEYTLNRVEEVFHDQVERSGHRHRASDIDRFASLGLTALRYPVLWEQVAPETLDAPDWAWTDVRLERIRAAGMRPIAGLLHHGSGPAYTSLLDPRFPVLLARYARMVAQRYPWVTDYTPVNEPLTTARFSALYGLWYPHARSDRAFVRALLNQTRGVALAMRAIRGVTPAARLVQTEDCGACFGTRQTREQVVFENHRRWLTWDLLVGRVDAAHPLRRYLEAHGGSPAELDRFCEHPVAPDVIGLNYYVTSDRVLDHRLDRYPSSRHGGNGTLRYADVEAVRARRRGLIGHRAHLVEAWHRYRLPVALTEVHLACTREEQARWLAEAWQGAHDARAEGAEVLAVTPWALMGSYDWDSLVTASKGRYESGAFDVRSSEPRPTSLVPMIRQLSRDDVPVHPGLAQRGWWHRPERIIHRSGKEVRQPGEAQGPPLLIVGSTGTLGRAFERVARERGLLTRSASRAELDITDPVAVRRLVAQVGPWAVINAAGYVRVDDAERDDQACFDVNTAGAAHVAAACRAQDVRLVTYSSDLVFDGGQDRAYTERDAPRPLSVYGASKAEAERRVLEILPSALVVRTSAFFGPWDASNFLIRSLQALGRGEPCRAASDVIVSPTYVPDLVHAALDLLLDGERGLWHLTNQGAMSWHDFARHGAITCGIPADGIESVPADYFGWPAPRPAYSALTSVRGRLMRSTHDAIAAFAASVSIEQGSVVRSAHAGTAQVLPSA
jgi:dTDP-4-dehydrorhamnose reductase